MSIDNPFSHCSRLLSDVVSNGTLNASGQALLFQAIWAADVNPSSVVRLLSDPT
jgi:hypothetical protein